VDIELSEMDFGLLPLTGVTIALVHEVLGQAPMKIVAQGMELSGKLSEKSTTVDFASVNVTLLLDRSIYICSPLN
jgi:hypothetical protein